MPGEAGEEQQLDNEFVEDTMDLDDIPQIDLPFRDDISNEFKNLLRALLVNQQNIINNCSFLYARVKELGMVLKRIAQDGPEQPGAPDNLPSLYSVPEE